MKVYWSSQAEQDRADIMDYIATDNVHAAIEMDELFGAAAQRLAEFPMLGKPSVIAGARALVAHEN
jgi:toxin ParE1/3/4